MGAERLTLPYTVLRELARDIETHGSFQEIQHGSLKKILDKRPDIFGERGSDLRRRICRKFYRWRKMSPSDYHEKVLRSFGLL